MLLKLLNCLLKTIFHHFFLQIPHINEIRQKTDNTTTSKPPVPWPDMLAEVA